MLLNDDVAAGKELTAYEKHNKKKILKKVLRKFVKQHREEPQLAARAAKQALIYFKASLLYFNSNFLQTIYGPLLKPSWKY